MRSLSGFEANVLINNEGHACLADFSLLTMVLDDSTITSSWTGGGAIPWMSPELLDPEKYKLGGHPTKESDCYALGMLIYEVLSGERPFASHSLSTVMRIVLEGGRPERPEGHKGRLFTDSIWEVVKHCWEAEPGLRANARVVLLHLEEDPPWPTGNPDEGMTVDYRDDYQLDETPNNPRMFSPFCLKSQAYLQSSLWDTSSPRLTSDHLWEIPVACKIKVAKVETLPCNFQSNPETGGTSSQNWSPNQPASESSATAQPTWYIGFTCSTGTTVE